MTDLETVTVDEHRRLRDAGALDANYWNEQPADEKPFYKRFKAEVKDYYRGEQNFSCCYCSVAIQDDHSTFDAEHVLDKSTHPKFMFELNNLAAACRPCNRAKNAKDVLVDGVHAEDVPAQDVDYRIVHPHLDEWDHYLDFDEFGRIQPKPHSPKGAFTIEACGIHAINATRLATFFGKGRRTAEMLLREFFEYTLVSKKQDCLELLRKLDDRSNLKARAIIGRLEEEMKLEAELRLAARRHRRLEQQRNSQQP